MTWKKAAVCSLTVHKELGMGEGEGMLSSTKPLRDSGWKKLPHLVNCIIWRGRWPSQSPGPGPREVAYSHMGFHCLSWKGQRSFLPLFHWLVTWPYLASGWLGNRGEPLENVQAFISWPHTPEVAGIPKGHLRDQEMCLQRPRAWSWALHSASLTGILVLFLPHQWHLFMLQGIQ